MGGAVSQEDLSSLSSCQSNLDNIRPPTIMDDIDNMDHSMISVASLPPSEVIIIKIRTIPELLLLAFRLLR